MSKQEQRPEFPVLQRALLKGFLHLEQLMRALENPHWGISRRTLLAGGGLALLAGTGFWLNRRAAEISGKEKTEIVLEPGQEIFNEWLGLVFSNATKKPITFFPQRLGDFLAEEQLTLPKTIKIGFLLKDDPQPQTIKMVDLTFYFNLQDPAHQNLDLELVLSAHIFSLLDSLSKMKWENIPQNSLTNGF